MEFIVANHSASNAESGFWQQLFAKEDGWSIWIGLGIMLSSLALFVNGSNLSWLAVVPAKWKNLDDLLNHFQANALRYGALFLVFAALFGGALAHLKISFRHFLPSFLFLFVLSLVIFAIGQWDQASRYNLEPPLLALGIGLLIANTHLVPSWLEAGFRVEFYIKIGIVLLGATLPITLILWAGPVAILQATIVSLTTFGVIYFTGTKLGLDRRLAATLGAGGAVCGVSGSIAIAGAVGAKKEHAPIAISLVIFWAIVMIFALPLISRALLLPTGVAGAWIGTSEFADAAGFAAAQAYGSYAGQVPGIEGSPDAAVNAFTLIKVIGRDVWIGIWALILSIVATTRWEDTGVRGRASVHEIWVRFPKFVLGFFAASIITSLVSQGVDYATYKAKIEPLLVAPVRNLRTWAFIFSFLSIGLTTRFRDFAQAGWKPVQAFTLGVAVNVVLGYFLSTQVFVESWQHLGR
jgi:uncharacterized membrane protein YadS